ncbi:hypothetical protein ACR79M_05065 [Sphingobacterium spiritivorum]|uniref:hypothetical protein n=1 Tax=Sphingobacterium TaxID=28453 RepID=UPI0025CF4B7C|nr:MULTISPECIES: hypothetical protein [unclassified Sphingobacterium]
MKNILISLTLICVLLFTSATAENKTRFTGCEMASTYAELAFMTFKKAYQSTSIENAKPLLKDGVAKAAEASAYAIIPSCNCANAKNYALNAVTFGNKALKESDLEGMKKWAKKAMDMSLDVLTATPNCK